MKNRVLIICMILLGPVIRGFSQSGGTENDFGIDFGGFVRYEMYYDTYNSVDSRDGNIYLYPLRPDEDLNGDDINQSGQLEMLAYQTRLKGTITGPEAFGAKTSGRIEMDFEGTSQNYVAMLRVRHAFLNLNWGKTELLLGQTWHPMFVASCFSRVLSFGAGLPFQPFSRAPQARITHYLQDNLSIMAAAIIHGYNRAPGPYDAQRNSGMPDMQVQVKYTSGGFHAGMTAGYKFLTPRLETSTGYKTDETIGSYNLQGFLKLTSPGFIAKLQGVMGENLSSYTTIGGYAVKANSFSFPEEDYSYTNMKTFSVWTELMSNNETVNYGIFAGYLSNLGLTEEYSIAVAQPFMGGRGEDISSMFRISPRVVFTSGSVDLGIEALYTSAAYGIEFDEYYEAQETETSGNLRVLFSAKYAF